MKKFDQHARAFLDRAPDAVVVHIGCGLDTRFERVDNGRVEWFDLDLPDVIVLRKNFIDMAAPRCHMLSGSVLEDKWLDDVMAYHRKPFLFLAEGVFPYFDEFQVKLLMLKVRDHFPGAELGVRDSGTDDGKCMKTIEKRQVIPFPAGLSDKICG